MASDFLVDDGIIVWFDGPEWDEVAAEVFNQAKDRVQYAAQSGAPWADRTGAARAGLETAVENDNGDIVLTLYHTVEYGLWLEVIQNGNYAIILPTLEREAPSIFADAVQAISEARAGIDY